MDLGVVGTLLFLVLVTNLAILGSNNVSDISILVFSHQFM